LVSKAISGKCGIIVHTLKFTRVNITNEKRDHRRLQVDMEETLTEFATDFAEETNSGMGFTPKKDI
jgi:hypothetical protein